MAFLKNPDSSLGSAHEASIGTYEAIQGEVAYRKPGWPPCRAPSPPNPGSRRRLAAQGGADHHDLSTTSLGRFDCWNADPGSVCWHSSAHDDRGSASPEYP